MEVALMMRSGPLFESKEVGHDAHMFFHEVRLKRRGKKTKKKRA